MEKTADDVDVSDRDILLTPSSRADEFLPFGMSLDAYHQRSLLSMMALEKEYFQAAEEGDLRKLKSILLSGKVDPNLAHMDTEETVLHISARNSNYNCIHYLVIKSPFYIDLNARNKDEQTPFLLAVEAGNLHCFQPFVLQSTEFTNNEYVIRSQVNPDVDLECVDAFGRNCLHYGVLGENIKIFIRLFGIADLDVNEQDIYGLTPLHIASSIGIEEMVHALIFEFEADVSITDYGGQSCLHLAAAGGHIGLLELFLELQPSLANLANRDGDLPIDVASEYEQEEAVELLSRFSDLSQ